MENHIACIGELLIDFFCTDIDVSLVKGKSFEKKAGGAPANVAATVAKHGGAAYFVGKVGEDTFGTFLEQSLLAAKVKTDHLLKTNLAKTTLAFVSLDSSGERDFEFMRGADGLLEEQDLNQTLIDSMHTLHFGSATALLTDPFRKTYINMMKKGKQRQQFIAFDPNYRSDLWGKDQPAFVEWVYQCLPYANYVKVSEEELYLLTQQEDMAEAVDRLHDEGVALVTVTLGKKGTYVSTRDFKKVISSIKVEAVDSTGAGDAFVGALLSQLSTYTQPLEVIKDEAVLTEMITYANVTAALVCTKVGAIESIPEANKVLDYIN